MAFGQTKTPGVTVLLRLEDRARSLLLEPLSRVPLVDTSGSCQLCRGLRSLLGEDAVETQTLAEVDAREVERPDCGEEEALDERVSTLASGLGGRQKSWFFRS